MAKSLIESIEEVQFIKEEVEGKKHLFVEGIFLMSEIENRNKRKYPKRIMQNEVARYTREHIDKRIAYGELGHPEGPTINPERISHRIVSLKEDGNNFIGKARVLSTPYGAIAAELISEGGLAVSSRGLGSVKRVGTSMEVQEDFMLATAADFVINPSAPDAFVEGLMEGQEWIWNPVKQMWVAEQLVREFHATKKIDEAQLIESWARFMTAI